MSDDKSTKVVNIINFHGITLWVVENKSTHYIYAKPLTDLAGLAWRSAKKTLLEEDNAKLYGTRELNHPSFTADGHDNVTPSTGIYIRLDRGRMYLARIQTSRMKAHGKVEAAEQLLAMQEEWAEAINQYETNGVAYKRAEKEDKAQLISLLKARASTTNQGERDAITRMIGDTLTDLGYPVEEAQQSLPLE